MVRGPIASSEANVLRPHITIGGKQKPAALTQATILIWNLSTEPPTKA